MGVALPRVASRLVVVSVLASKSKVEEVREMRDAETVLGIIQ